MPIQNRFCYHIEHMQFLKSLDGMTIEQAKEKETEFLNNLKIKSEYGDKMILKPVTKIED